MTLYHVLGSFIAILLLGFMASKLFTVPKLSAQAIIGHLAKYFPDFTIGSIEIDTKHQAALIKSASDDHFIAVKMLGDKISCREFSLSDIEQPSQTKNKFRLIFHDITYPDLTAEFDQNQQQAVSSWFQHDHNKRQGI